MTFSASDYSSSSSDSNESTMSTMTSTTTSTTTTTTSISKSSSTKSSSSSNFFPSVYTPSSVSLSSLPIISLSTLSSSRSTDDPSLPQLTALHGIVYDISPFLQSGSHPGGGLLRLAVGRDSTTLVESHHRIVANGKLKSILSNNSLVKVVGKLDGYQSVDNTFFNILKGRVEKELSSKSLSSHHHQSLLIIESIVLFILYFICAYYKCVENNYLFAVLGGIIIGRMGFLMHSGNHGGATSSSKMNEVMGMFMDLIGGSHFAWWHDHQVAHHGNPNELYKDNDCEIGFPLMRLHHLLPIEKMNKIYLQFQYIIVPVGITVGLAKWYFTDMVHFMHRKIGNLPFSPTRADWICVLFFKILWFIMHAALPMYWHGVGPTLLINLIYMGIGSHYIENIFIVNHIQEELQPTQISEEYTINQLGGKTENLHWAEKQILTTANWCSASPAANFISGGLNHQIEHHLFPAYSIYTYPIISSVVQNTCREYGLTYKDYPSFWSAWMAMITYVKRLGMQERVDDYARKHTGQIGAKKIQ